MSDPIGYAVVEVNQASGNCERLLDETLHWTEADARDEADRQRDLGRARGRRDHYLIAEVHLIKDPA